VDAQRARRIGRHARVQRIEQPMRLAQAQRRGHGDFRAARARIASTARFECGWSGVSRLIAGRVWHRARERQAA
jgi:hypothetical protein